MWDASGIRVALPHENGVGIKLAAELRPGYLRVPYKSEASGAAWSSSLMFKEGSLWLEQEVSEQSYFRSGRVQLSGYPSVKYWLQIGDQKFDAIDLTEHQFPNTRKVIPGQ